MNIASMTGFARVAGTTGPYAWAWEIRTVNGRGLDIRLRTPSGYDAVADEARRQLGKVLSRGQCQLSLMLTRNESTPRVRVNEDILVSLIDSLSRLPQAASIAPASLDGLLAVRGVVEIEEADEAQTAQDLDAALRAALPELAESVGAARAEEGKALAGVLAQQVATMERLVGEAEESPARTPQAIRARLELQLAPLLEGKASLDPERLYQEAALIAMRADIREELDRLRAHIDSARALLAEGGAIGRRLDFLAQEFGREANTLCAKANDVSLSRIGLELKALVDQFREQVQNVE